MVLCRNAGARGSFTRISTSNGGKGYRDQNCAAMVGETLLVSPRLPGHAVAIFDVGGVLNKTGPEVVQ